MSGVKVLVGEKEIGVHLFEKDSILLGRAPEVDIFIPNLAISRKHGRIFKKGGKWFYEDLCSTNGTYVKSFKISLCQLTSGTELHIGKCKIIFFDGPAKQDRISDYKIDFKKILEEDNEVPKAQLDESIKFDKTAIIKINNCQNSNERKQLKPIAYIEVVDTKEKINIDEEEIYIGKDSGCRIRLSGFFIAPRHAKIEYDGENIRLISLKSFPSVSVNGIKISERILKKDDYIDVGSYRLRIRFF